MDDIKICAWNVRGCNASSKIKMVNKFTRHNNISIFSILESKILQNKENLVAVSLLPNWRYTTNSDVINRGRIWVALDHALIEVSVLLASSQLVHCKVASKDGKISFTVSFIYALNDDLGRAGLWQQLYSLAPPITEPWLVMGDMNCMLDATKKLSFNGRDDIFSDELTQVCIRLKIKDIPYSGARYTWDNQQRGTARIAYKLDRVLANRAWFDCFHASTIFFADCSLPDHCPGILTVNPGAIA